MNTVGWLILAVVLYFLWKHFMAPATDSAATASSTGTTSALAANSSYASSTTSSSSRTANAASTATSSQSSQYAYPQSTSGGTSYYQASNGQTVKVASTAADGTAVTKVPQYQINQFAAIDAQEANTTGSYTGNGTTSTSTGTSSSKTYTVQSGDNLSTIAAQNGVSLAALEAANPSITNPNLIYAGQQLSIPTSRTLESTSSIQHPYHQIDNARVKGSYGEWSNSIAQGAAAQWHAAHPNEGSANTNGEDPFTFNPSLSQYEMNAVHAWQQTPAGRAAVEAEYS